MEGFAVGIKSRRGHRVARRTPAVRSKSRRSSRSKLVQSISNEVMGLAPYERRMIEQLKLGRTKNALRYAKKRIGSHKRAQKKRDNLMVILRA